MKHRTINKVLVPAAYPCIRNFIMDDALKVGETFIYDIPDLVLVAKSELLIYDVIYLHPATQSLLSKTGVSYYEMVLVNSNSIACEEAIKSEKACAITNKSCAAAYNLVIRRVLRKSIHMPFIIFEENNIS